jgi:hypothetical protein
MRVDSLESSLVVTRSDAEDFGTGGEAGERTGGGVFDDEATGRVGVYALRSLEVGIGVGLQEREGGVGCESGGRRRQGKHQEGRWSESERGSRESSANQTRKA